MKKKKRIKSKDDSSVKSTRITSLHESFQDDHPLFNLREIQKGYGLDRCEQNEKAALMDRLYILSSLTWVQIQNSPRHGLGWEKIARKALNPPLPKDISQDVNFYSLRFMGKKPFVGYRMGSVFHIVWIDNKYDVYNHGS